uniref:SERPIN domain-containing protein n=1 Tax=Bursaphelenchus xylophilus TaxID=6326 RepID=A0A1I7SE61_BURXY
MDIVSIKQFNKFFFRILLVNALYFKSSWQERFNPILTSQKEFFVEPKVSRKVRMMKKKSQFIYHDADDLQLLGIPYSGNETYMFMILPKRVEAINSISSVLDGKRLQSLLSRRERQLVNVEIPRFKLEEKTLLNRAMEKIGLKRGFSDDAQFTDIANGKLKINKLLHKVFIETNEEGTEAAAATAGGMFGIRPSMPEVVPDFIANHPFIFFITTKKNDILFEGIIREIKN